MKVTSKLSFFQEFEEPVIDFTNTDSVTIEFENSLELTDSTCKDIIKYIKDEVLPDYLRHEEDDIKIGFAQCFECFYELVLDLEIFYTYTWSPWNGLSGNRDYRVIKVAYK